MNIKIILCQSALGQREDKFCIIQLLCSSECIKRVTLRLERDGLYDEYCKVIYEQEREGIVGHIKVSPEHYNKYEFKSVSKYN